jgi:hypothetical protein
LIPIEELLGNKFINILYSLKLTLTLQMECLDLVLVLMVIRFTTKKIKRTIDKQLNPNKVPLTNNKIIKAYLKMQE